MAHAVDTYATKKTAMRNASASSKSDFHHNKINAHANIPTRAKKSSFHPDPVFTQRDNLFLNGDDDDDFDGLHDPTNTTCTRLLPDKSFIYYPKSTQPMSVLDMYLPKLKTKMSIKNDHDLISFYYTFRSRLESYNILLRSYDNINQQDGITLLNATNSENWAQANMIMSRAIFNYLVDGKDDIMKDYDYGYKLLKYYEPTHDGFGYLERLME